MDAFLDEKDSKNNFFYFAIFFAMQITPLPPRPEGGD
jgi:hypothetical protein